MYPIELKREIVKAFADNKKFVYEVLKDNPNATTYVDTDDLINDRDKLDAYLSIIKYNAIEENVKNNSLPQSTDLKEKSNAPPSKINNDLTNQINKQIAEHVNSKKNSSDESVLDSLQNSKKEDGDENSSKEESKELLSEISKDIQTNDKSDNNNSKDITSDITSNNQILDNNKNNSPSNMVDESNLNNSKPFLESFVEALSKDYDLIYELENYSIEECHSSQDGERHSIERPGGRSINRAEAKRIVRDWIIHFSESGIYSKVRGYKHWDKKVLVKHLVTDQEYKIPYDKMDRKPDDILFMLDFSPSCRLVSKMFADLGKMACTFPNVTVAYGGYEGYIQGFIYPHTDIYSIHSSWGIKDDEQRLSEYLFSNKSIRSIVILGDFDGTPRYVEAYLDHRDLKFIWFNCEQQSFYTRDEKELYGLKKNMYYFDGTIEDLARITKRLKRGCLER